MPASCGTATRASRVPLLDAAQRPSTGLRIGDNEPYFGSLKNDTMYRHGTTRGLAHALLEVRNDLIDNAGRRAGMGGPAGADACARSSPIRRCMQIRHYGSSSDEDDERRSETTMQLDDATRTALEAAAFRRLVAHLRERTDVQNIDLMNLAGFCRNCLSNWYREAAEEKGLALSKEESREIVYGMPYDEWRAKYQADAPMPPRRRSRKIAPRTAEYGFSAFG